MSTIIQPDLFDIMTESVFPKLSDLTSSTPKVQEPKHDICPLVKYAQDSSVPVEKYILEHLEKGIDFYVSIPDINKDGFFYVVQSVKGKLKTNKKAMPESKVQKYLNPKFRDPITDPRIRQTVTLCPAWDRNYLEGSAI